MLESSKGCRGSSKNKTGMAQFAFIALFGVNLPVN